MEFSHLLRGASVRSVLLVGNVLVGFFMLPYLIHNLGMEIYGLWLIVGSVIGYFGIMDFGLLAAAQRFLSAAYANKEREGITRALNTSIVANCLLALILLTIAGLVYAFSSVFFDDIELNQLFDTLILIMSLKFLLTMPLAAFNGVVTAFIRHDIAAKIELLKLVFRTALFVCAIEVGYGVIGVAVSMLVTELLGSLAIYFAAKSLDSDIRIQPSSSSLTELKSFANYGKYSFILNIANTFRFQVDNLVIGKTVGLDAVSIYAVASALNRYRVNAFNALIGMFQPTFTKLDTLGSQSYLADKIRQVFCVSLFLSCSSSLVFILFGAEIIDLWVGDAFMSAYFCLVLFAINAMVSLSTSPLQTYLNAVAKHKANAYATLLESMLNVTLSIYLAHKIGIAGVAIGTVVPTVFFRLFFLIPHASKYINLAKNYFYLKILQGVTLIFVTVGAFKYLFLPLIDKYSLVYWAASALLIVVFCGLFFMITFDRSVKKYIFEKIRLR